MGEAVPGNLILSDDEIEELEKIAQLATSPPLEAIGQEIHAGDGGVGQTGRLVGAIGSIRRTLRSRNESRRPALCCCTSPVGDGPFDRLRAALKAIYSKGKFINLSTEAPKGTCVMTAAEKKESGRG